MIDRIFNALSAHFSTLPVADVDWYSEQYDPDVNLVLATPALYISFDELLFEDLPDRLQRSDSFVFVHVVSDAPENGSRQFNPLFSNHFDLVKQVKEHVHGRDVLTPDVAICNILRRSARPDHQSSVYFVTVLRFDFSAYELPLSPSFTEATLDAFNVSVVSPSSL